MLNGNETFSDLLFNCCTLFLFKQVNIKDKVLELLMYFTKHSDEEVQTKAIIGLGEILHQIWNIYYVYQ